MPITNLKKLEKKYLNEDYIDLEYTNTPEEYLNQIIDCLNDNTRITKNIKEKFIDYLRKTKIYEKVFANYINKKIKAIEENENIWVVYGISLIGNREYYLAYIIKDNENKIKTEKDCFKTLETWGEKPHAWGVLAYTNQWANYAANKLINAPLTVKVQFLKELFEFELRQTEKEHSSIN